MSSSTVEQDKIKDAVETMKEIDEGVKTVVPIATEIIQQLSKAVKFVIHCFGCKNEKGTPVLLHHDSIQIKAVRNSVQVQGVCATCGKKVHGFISAAKAKELGYKRKLPNDATAEGEPEAKRVVATGIVGEPEPDVQENKQ